VAWDPDPAKVAAVRRLGDDAELVNLVTHEQPAPPASDELPFDIVVVDGLIDSVSHLERNGFATAAAALLRPGGVACVTYRTLVGWGEIAPVAQLLQHFALHPHRDRVRAVDDAKRLLNELRERRIAYFSRPAVDGWLDDLLETPTGDIVDRYVDRDLVPISHAQVTGLLAAAGATYVGSTDPAADLRDPLPPKLDRQLRSATSTLLRETLGDLARRRAHRADLFCLGPAPIAPRERTHRLGNLRVIGLADDSEPATTKNRWAGTKARQREQELRQALGSGVVHPLVDEPVSPTAVEAATRLTGVLAGSGVPKEQRHVVVPLLGSALPASMLTTTSLRTALGTAAR
jgi:hypothetical protein